MSLPAMGLLVPRMWSVVVALVGLLRAFLTLFLSSIICLVLMPPFLGCFPDGQASSAMVGWEEGTDEAFFRARAASVRVRIWLSLTILL